MLSHPRSHISHLEAGHSYQLSTFKTLFWEPASCSHIHDLTSHTSKLVILIINYQLLLQPVLRTSIILSYPRSHCACSGEGAAKHGEGVGDGDPAIDISHRQRHCQHQHHRQHHQHRQHQHHRQQHRHHRQHQHQLLPLQKIFHFHYKRHERSVHHHQGKPITI